MRATGGLTTKKRNESHQISPHPIDVSVLVAAHALQDGTVQTEFEARFVQHLPLIRIPGDETVDLDRFRLADTMTPRLGLEKKTSRIVTVQFKTGATDAKHTNAAMA